MICPKNQVLSASEVNSFTDPSDPLVYAYGRYYKIDDLIGNHGLSYGVESFKFQSLLGQDISSLFYKQNSFSDHCPGLPNPGLRQKN